MKKKNKNSKGHPLLALAASSPLAAVAFVCKYILPGYSFTYLVCLCLIGVICFYCLMPWVGNYFPGFAHWATIVFTVVLVLGLTVCAVTEGFIIHAAFGDPDEHADYMVVLGAKVNPFGPSVSLQDRIDKAYDYLNEHPDVIAVVSGGQGNDEVMSEAQCMFEELTQMGIDPQRIWMEDKASSTDENMRFSLDLIQEKTGQRPTKLAILSSEYHLFRASLMAKKLGLEFVGVPARTTRPSQLINHCMREVAGVWHFILLGW